MTNSLAPARQKSWFISRPATWRQIGADLEYILPGFFVSLASFTALVTLFSLGLSTIIIWVGLPVLVATLATAHWFADRRTLSTVRSWPSPTAPHRSVLPLPSWVPALAD